MAFANIVAMPPPGHTLLCHVSTMSHSAPIDAASRGKLRVFKRALAQRHDRIMRVYEGDTFGRAAGDFREKRGVGQRRALAKVRHMLAEARFVEARTERPPHILWAVLKPRDAVIVDAPNEPGRAPGLRDDRFCRRWRHRHPGWTDVLLGPECRESGRGEGGFPKPVRHL